MELSLKPDYREFIAENIGIAFLFVLSVVAMPYSTHFGLWYVSMLSLVLSMGLAFLLLVRYIILTSVVWIIYEDTLCRIKGVFSRRTDYTELYRVVDYEESQTFLQKLLKIKSVRIISTDKSDSILEMYGIDVSLDVVKLVRNRVEKCKQEKEFMKSQIVKVLLLVMCLTIGHATSGSCGVQTDPVLTGAIINQLEVLKKIYARRDSTQKKIIAAEAAVTVAMTRMHEVENKVLEYMSNVSGAFQNLYQIKRAGELVAIEIPHNMAEVRRAIGEGHFEGTAMGIFAGKELGDITTQMMSLYPFMAELVTSGTYSSKDIDENGNIVTKHNKVNLLNSYERYYICNTVVSSLEDINRSLMYLSWEIRTMRWRDIFYALDPEGWFKVLDMKNTVDYAVREWDYQMSHF